ncbi:hypothetical protein CSS90_07935 [Salmonella enterica subsp. enterica serovar Schwarzengrund]|nr:hypothetical protein [Salmonella enterica subsp. enterica serovar Schwarzengrund]EBG4881069.1 hypothetical protein [Salmonella enterica subsp. enterica serovar Schwarzengrund]EBO1744433.1 hypothetical protein [Salmonella enterica subsp. enterica serovar Schwarzengrund]ECB8179554.1 hypothetical protein [Salmonella enterica subsp. enterica serovar Schwarzengrund]ECH6614485.1 hypothetical protein [Salmonella enterica subsp. enterica serovar Schwarzengrund]
MSAVYTLVEHQPAHSSNPKANYSLVPAFRRDNPINVKEPANLFRLATSFLLMCLVSPLVVFMSTPPEIIYHRRWLSVCFLYRFIFCRGVLLGGSRDQNCDV